MNDFLSPSHGNPLLVSISDYEKRFFRKWVDINAVGDLTVRNEAVDAADFYKPPQPGPRELQAQHDAIIAAAREEGAAAERERIAQKLEALKPMEEPYTRRDWAIEQKGEKRMYERVLRALFGPEKKGEA